MIAQTLQDHLSIANSQVNNPVQLITFVKAGDSIPSKWKHQATSNILSGTNDWNMIVDLENQNYIFPPEIYNTSERPDMLLQNISRQSNWKPVLLTIEMGARGFVSSSSKQTLFLLGVSSSKVHSLCKNMPFLYYILGFVFKAMGSFSATSATKLKIIIYFFHA